MRPNCLLISIAILSAAATASAQPVGSSSGAPFTMPNLTTQRAAGAELSFVSADIENSDESITSVVLALAGHVEVAPGFQVEGRLPLVYGTFPGVDGDASEIDIGNLSVGAQFFKRDGDITGGGGIRIYAPTATEPDLFGESEDGLAVFSALLTQFDRFAEFLPDATTFNLHGDLRFDNGQMFAQGQLALNVVDGDNDNVNLITANVAVGARPIPQLALLAEIKTLSSILEDEDETDPNEFLHWARVGARYQLQSVELGGHVYVPIDSITEESIGVGIDVMAHF